MSHHFGPWATAINTGADPQLSRFWRRRLARFPAVAAGNPACSRPAATTIVLAAVAIGLMPALCGRNVTAKGAAPSPWKELGGLAKALPDRATPGRRHAVQAAASSVVAAFVLNVAVLDRAAADSTPVERELSTPFESDKPLSHGPIANDWVGFETAPIEPLADSKTAAGLCWTHLSFRDKTAAIHVVNYCYFGDVPFDWLHHLGPQR